MKYSSLSEFVEGGASFKENAPKASTAEEVFKKVRENDLPSQEAARQTNMKRIKVKSNSERSSTVVYGDRGSLVLKFDSEGVASFPPHQLELMKTIMRSRPGRFKLIGQEAPAAPMPSAEAQEMLQKLKEAEEQSQADKEAAILAAAVKAAEAEQAKEEAAKAEAQAEADRIASEAAEAARADTELPPAKKSPKKSTKSTKSKAKKSSGRKPTKK